MILLISPAGSFFNDIGPQGKTGVVAQIVEILIVLIVGQTDGVGTQLLDQSDILFVVGLGDCPTLVLAAYQRRNFRPS